MADKTAKSEAQAHRQAMHQDLTRLVEAIDRRVPRLTRLGEDRIAAEAAELRARAVALLEQLKIEEG